MSFGKKLLTLLVITKMLKLVDNACLLFYSIPYFGVLPKGTVKGSQYFVQSFYDAETEMPQGAAVCCSCLED